LARGPRPAAAGAICDIQRPMKSPGRALLLVGEGADAAAEGVAEHDDVADAQACTPNSSAALVPACESRCGS